MPSASNADCFGVVGSAEVMPMLDVAAEAVHEVKAVIGHAHPRWNESLINEPLQ